MTRHTPHVRPLRYAPEPRWMPHASRPRTRFPEAVYIVRDAVVLGVALVALLLLVTLQ